MKKYTFRTFDISDKSKTFLLRLPFSSVSFNFAIKGESKLIFTSETTKSEYIAYPNDYDESENICMLFQDNNGLVAEIYGYIVNESYIISEMFVLEQLTNSLLRNRI